MSIVLDSVLNEMVIVSHWMYHVVKWTWKPLQH